MWKWLPINENHQSALQNLSAHCFGFLAQNFSFVIDPHNSHPYVVGCSMQVSA